MKKWIVVSIITSICVGVGILLYSRVARPKTLLSQPLIQSHSESPALSIASNVEDVLSQQYIVYGFVPYWTYKEANISPTLTHISYFSIPIQTSGKLFPNDAKDKDLGLKRFETGALDILLAKMHPDQKLEITLTMLSSEAIKKFLDNPSALLTYEAELETLLSSTPHISGLTIDVEYSGLIDQTMQDSFVKVVTITNTVIKRQPKKVHLSIATYGDAAGGSRLTDIERLAPLVDHVIIMAYDYHTRSSPRAGPIAPLYGSTLGKWESDLMANLKEYRDIVPANKIILGIPFYGYEWSVTDTNEQPFTIPKTGATATYKRVQELLATNRVEKKWDETAFSPYISYSLSGQERIIYYEDERSLTYKLELVRQAGLAGIAIWAIGYEGTSTTLFDVIEKQLIDPS